MTVYPFTTASSLKDVNSRDSRRLDKFLKEQHTILRITSDPKNPSEDFKRYDALKKFANCFWAWSTHFTTFNDVATIESLVEICSTEDDVKICLGAATTLRDDLQKAIVADPTAPLDPNMDLGWLALTRELKIGTQSGGTEPDDIYETSVKDALKFWKERGNAQTDQGITKDDIDSLDVCAQTFRDLRDGIEAYQSEIWAEGKMDSDKMALTTAAREKINENITTIASWQDKAENELAQHRKNQYLAGETIELTRKERKFAKSLSSFAKTEEEKAFVLVHGEDLASGAYGHSFFQQSKEQIDTVTNVISSILDNVESSIKDTTETPFENKAWDLFAGLRASIDSSYKPKRPVKGSFKGSKRSAPSTQTETGESSGTQRRRRI